MERLLQIVYALFHLPCFFQAVTGFYCPGCGGTRAVKALLQGDFWKSICYHPLVPYAALAVLLLAGSGLWAKLSGKPERYLGHESLLIYIGVGITAVNWIGKNLYLLLTGIDVLAALG